MHAMAAARVALQWSGKSGMNETTEDGKHEGGAAAAAAAALTLPCILVGDFNFRPHFPAYRLLTTGCSLEPRSRAGDVGRTTSTTSDDGRQPSDDGRQREGTTAISASSDAVIGDAVIETNQAGAPEWRDDQGKTWSEHMSLPTPEYDTEYAFDLTLPRPLYSAYARCMGKEPDFTNSAASTHALKPEPEEFIGTLDYIFCRYKCVWDYV
jgi:hypothetical protein